MVDRPYLTLESGRLVDLPRARLLALTGGKIFHDDLGIEEIRRRFTYYPHDVWLYLMAVQWELIAQEGLLWAVRSCW